MSVAVPVRIGGFLEDVTRRLQREQGDNLVQVCLFGSHARGDARPDSDVDVLVVVDHLTLQVKDRILETVSDAALDHDVPAGPLIWDVERWKHHAALKTLLFRHLRSEGVVVWSRH